MSLFSSGNTLGIPHILLNPLVVRGEQRSSTSNAMLLPSRELWSQDDILVTTPRRTYTVNDYEDFFNDLQYPTGIKLRHLVENLTYPLSAHAPHVALHCLYGVEVQTRASFTFGEGEFPDTPPKVTYGDGDGTVNRRSLEACNKWVQRQRYPVAAKEYPSVDHNGILSNTDAHNYVKSLLFSKM